MAVTKKVKKDKNASPLIAGRRKTSVARVRVTNGTGNIIINKKDINEYFSLETMKQIVKQPLVLTNTLDKVDVLVNVYGGGLAGQAGAIRLGIARGLVKLDETYKPSDVANPQNIYGKSKYLGEQIARLYDKSFVVRTSWVFGINGKNFVKTMLRLAETKTELSVVDDQIGSPTYSKDLAKLLVDMSLTDKYGVYHATNEGFCSWYEFAQKIFELTNSKILLHAISSNNYPQKATRPKNSRLSKDCLVENNFEKLPYWEDALKEYLVELEENK